MRQIEKVLIISILIILSLACFQNTSQTSPKVQEPREAQAATTSNTSPLGTLCPNLKLILPTDWKPFNPIPLNTAGDENQECVLFYHFDFSAEAPKQGPINGVIYHLGEGRPPSIIPYKLTLNTRDHLCEHHCTASMEDVLSGWEGKELIIEDKDTESGDVKRLSLFRWDPDIEPNGGYKPLGNFSGDNITHRSKDKVVEYSYLENRSQLATKTTKYPFENKTYYGDNLPEPRSKIIFQYSEPETIENSPYPEKVVFGFYTHYPSREKIQPFFKEESWTALEECSEGQCGCQLPYESVTWVRVTHLKTDSEDANQATVNASIICEAESCEPNCPERHVTLYLVRIDEYWKLEDIETR